MLNIHNVKQQICEIGQRIYKKGFAAANDGNISWRVSENEIVCTPTMISKGFMKPEDLCIVDLDGKQLSGRRKSTSEIKLHLAIMKSRPDVKSVVHCHPPHATAFGIAREPVPQCVLPEVEIFLGEVPTAKYETPGSQEFADTILPFVQKSNVIILANHGTVSFGPDVETAYWYTEILDAYCRMLMLSRSLGRVNYFTEPEARALLELKDQLGLKDPRAELQNCELCSNDVFRESWTESGVEQQAFQPPRFGTGSCSLQANRNPQTGQNSQTGQGSNGQPVQSPSNGVDQEALVQQITDRVIAALQQR